MADLGDQRRDAQPGWWPLLWFFGKVCMLPVPVHLAARDAAPLPLRPVHEVRLEGADPGLAGLDRRWSSTFRGLRDELGAATSTLTVAGGAWAPWCWSSWLVRARGRPDRRRAEARGRGELAEASRSGPLDAFAGGTRCRRMPGQTFEYTPRARRTVPSAVAAAPSSQEEVPMPELPPARPRLRDHLPDPVQEGRTPSSTRRRRTSTRPSRASTAATSSTGIRTGWRSASAASCAPGPVPADAIFVEGADNTDEERYSPGERYGRVYQINYLRCILCGLCIEACPTRALTMTNEYELADNDRAKLIYEKARPARAAAARDGRPAARDGRGRRRGRLLPRRGDRRHRRPARRRSTQRAADGAPPSRQRPTCEPARRPRRGGSRTPAQASVEPRTPGEQIAFWVCATPGGRSVRWAW